MKTYEPDLTCFLLPHFAKTNIGPWPSPFFPLGRYRLPYFPCYGKALNESIRLLPSFRTGVDA